MMSMFRVLVLLLIFLISNQSQAEQLFTTHIVDPSMDKRAIALVDTITKTPRLIEINTQGKVTWSWDIPSEMIDDRAICRGSDVKYVSSDDSFIITVPQFGAVAVQRDGTHKILVRDSEIDHDIHVFKNGSILFPRGFVDKGEDNFAIKDSNGNQIWSWDASDHIGSRKPYWGSTCKIREKSWNKKGSKDWAHANAIEVLDNGNYLLSLRNLSAFFEVDPEGRILKEYKGHVGVHEPKVYKDGFVLADRNCTRDSKSNYKEFNAIKILDGNGKTVKILLEGQHLFARGIEVLANERLFITTISSLMEIDTNGKVYFKAVLKGLNPELESEGREARSKMTGSCRPKTVYKAVRTK